jgi:hypothetical protein
MRVEGTRNSSIVIVVSTKRLCKLRHSTNIESNYMLHILVHPRGVANPQDGNTDTEHSLI